VTVWAGVLTLAVLVCSQGIETINKLLSQEAALGTLERLFLRPCLEYSVERRLSRSLEALENRYNPQITVVDPSEIRESCTVLQSAPSALSLPA